MSVDFLSFAEDYYFEHDAGYRAIIRAILKERGLPLHRSAIWETQPEMSLFARFKYRTRQMGRNFRRGFYISDRKKKSYAKA